MNIAEEVKSAFFYMYEYLQKKSSLVAFASEFTDMREVETINFLAIYLLGVTRYCATKEEAWEIADSLLDKILNHEIPR